MNSIEQRGSSFIDLQFGIPESNSGNPREAIMSNPTHPKDAFRSVIINRNYTVSVLAGFALTAAVASVFVSTELIESSKPDSDTTVCPASLLHGVSAAFLFSTLMLPWLWGATESVRAFLCSIVPFFFVALPLGFSGLTAEQYALAASVSLCVISVLVMVGERSKTISYGSEGIEYRRLIPVPGTVTIPWNRVETVAADLRVITTVSGLVPGSFDTQENYLTIRGAENTIRLNTTRYRGGNKHVDTIINRSRDACIQWMVSEWNASRDVNLGILRMKRDGIEKKINSVSWFDLPQILGSFFVNSIMLFFGLLIVLGICAAVIRQLSQVMPAPIAVGIGLGVLGVILILMIVCLLGRKKPFFSYAEIEEVSVNKGVLRIGDVGKEKTFPAQLVRNALYLPAAIDFIQHANDGAES